MKGGEEEERQQLAQEWYMRLLQLKVRLACLCICTHSCIPGLQSLKYKHTHSFSGPFLSHLEDNRWINLLQSWTLNHSLNSTGENCSRNCVCLCLSVCVWAQYHLYIPFSWKRRICAPNIFLIFIRPSYSRITVVCRSITMRRFPLATRAFVCLSMSILLKRDMFPSPRKLPQARNTTLAPANNCSCALMSGRVCATGAGGELHWFIVNRGQQLPVSVSGRYNKWCARSDALYCSSASNLFSCWPRTQGGAACWCVCMCRDIGGGGLCAVSNICPPESSDREVSSQRMRQNSEEILTPINYI